MIGRKLLQKLAQTVLWAEVRSRTRPCTTSSRRSLRPRHRFQVRSAAIRICRWPARRTSSVPNAERHFSSPAVVSGEAEADFERGTRQSGRHKGALRGDPKVGGGYSRASSSRLRSPCSARPFPRAIGDEFLSAHVDELRHAKGMASCCCPTIRAAASSTASDPPAHGLSAARQAQPRRLGLFLGDHSRAPQTGRKPCLPVSEDVRHWHASPRAAVGFLLHVGGAGGRAHRAAAQSHDARAFGDDRGSRSPRLRRVPGRARAPHRREPDPAIMRISRLAAEFRRTSARAKLGFRGRRQLRGDHVEYIWKKSCP